MNTISLIQKQIETFKNLHLIESVEVILLKTHVFKARLVISENIFIQVYRNDKFLTTSFTLILNRKRIYGRDELKGKWHKHPLEKPELHNSSAEGQKEVNLLQFWQEVEKVLRKLGLI